MRTREATCGYCVKDRKTLFIRLESRAVFVHCSQCEPRLDCKRPCKLAMRTVVPRGVVLLKRRREVRRQLRHPLEIRLLSCPPRRRIPARPKASSNVLRTTKHQSKVRTMTMFFVAHRSHVRVHFLMKTLVCRTYGTRFTKYFCAQVIARHRNRAAELHFLLAHFRVPACSGHSSFSQHGRYLWVVFLSVRSASNYGKQHGAGVQSNVPQVRHSSSFP